MVKFRDDKYIRKICPECDGTGADVLESNNLCYYCKGFKIIVEREIHGAITFPYLNEYNLNQSKKTIERRLSKLGSDLT